MLATANPVEYEGTYPLPEAQLDRFLLRVGFGYPSADEEWDVLRRRLDRRQEEIGSTRSPTPPGLLAMQAALETVTVDAASARYCVRAGRGDPQPRRRADRRRRRAARWRLVLTARAYAVIQGRDYVVPEDVKAVARRGARAPDHGQAGALDDRR